MAPDHFQPGTNVVWRSVHDDHVGYVFAATVIVDSPNIIALHQPNHAPILRREGPRGGPQGRSLLTWTGQHRPAQFTGGPVIRAHQPGTHYSIIRRLTPSGPQGWYINLELPWQRTPIGYDSRDLTIDITANDTLTTYTWKDKDELDWQRDNGRISPAQHHHYLHQAHTAIEHARSRHHLFNDQTWATLDPDPNWDEPQLPPDATHPKPAAHPSLLAN